MASLTVIRGLPGSGKSTLAEAMGKALNIKVLDVDHYFVDEDGNFEFSSAKAADVFRKLHHDAEDLLIDKQSVIVVATFTRRWEIAGFVRMPYDNLQVIDCHGDFGSIHDVPKANLRRMKERWESWK